MLAHYYTRACVQVTLARRVLLMRLGKETRLTRKPAHLFCLYDIDKVPPGIASQLDLKITDMVIMAASLHMKLVHPFP